MYILYIYTQIYTDTYIQYMYNLRCVARCRSATACCKPKIVRWIRIFRGCSTKSRVAK